MEFSKELYPTFEEARDATLEHQDTQEALEDFFFLIDRWESDENRMKALKALGEKLIARFEREKNRAKDCSDEGADSEKESA